MQAEFKIQSTHYVELKNISPRDKFFFFKLIAHVHDTTYQIENFIRLILRMSRFLVTMHVFCFNFNTFLKTSSLFFTLHATYRYIQINIKKPTDKTQKHMLCYLKKTISCLILYRHLMNTNTSNNHYLYCTIYSVHYILY